LAATTIADVIGSVVSNPCNRKASSKRKQIKWRFAHRRLGKINAAIALPASGSRLIAVI